MALVDVNDESPTFTAGIHTASFQETTTAPATLTVTPTLLVTDKDSIGTYSYTFLEGNTPAYFGIDDSTPKSPVLRLTQAVSFFNTYLQCIQLFCSISFFKF